MALRALAARERRSDARGQGHQLGDALEGVSRDPVGRWREERQALAVVVAERDELAVQLQLADLRMAIAAVVMRARDDRMVAPQPVEAGVGVTMPSKR
jgi:hypothetical protein